MKLPRIGVGVVVLEGSQVLLIKRGKPPRMGHWSIPGGHLNWGETVQVGAIREVREETGLDITIEALIDVIDLINHDESGEAVRHICLLDYWGRATGGTLQAGDDAMDAAWFPIAGLDTMDLWPATYDIIRKAIAMRAAQEDRLS